jgi:hypothetical protein
MLDLLRGCVVTRVAAPLHIIVLDERITHELYDGLIANGL